MILKEVKPGKYVESRKFLRGIKVERLGQDAEKFVDMMYMPLADDAQFVEETRNAWGETGTDTLYYHDFSHISEGAFKETVVKVSRTLSKLIFLKKIDEVNRRLI